MLWFYHNAGSLGQNLGQQRQNEAPCAIVSFYPASLRHCVQHRKHVMLSKALQVILLFVTDANNADDATDADHATDVTGGPP